MLADSLYKRLGGYDAISAVCDDLLARLTSDSLLARFWENRGEDGLKREKQLLVDFLCSSAGGPLLYTGRDMLITHRGMGITDADWASFIAHLNATLDQFQVPETERKDVLGFVDSTRSEIVNV